YFALARVTAYIPGVSAAVAATLVAVVAGAITVANVSVITGLLCRSRAAAICATGMLMVSHTLWQLSASAEVMTTSTALLSAEVLLLIHWIRSRQTAWLALALLANGLGVSNHNFALLMWPVYLSISIRWRSLWWNQRAKLVPVALVSLVVGMIPILILCVDTLLTTGSVTATLKSLLVGHYGSRMLHVSRLPILMARTVGVIVLNYPTPCLLLLVPGFLALRRAVEGPIAWLIIGPTTIFLVFGMTYDVPDQHTFLLPALMFMAIVVAVGLDGLLQRRPSRQVMALAFMLALMAPAVYGVIPSLGRRFAPNSALVPARSVPYRERWNWFLQPWRNGCTGPERYASETLNALPQGAWLSVGNTLCAPLNYLQVAEHLRRDVRLESWIARQDWFDRRATEDEPARAAKLAEGLVYATANEPSYLLPWLTEIPVRFERVGHVYHVVPLD
ncbi:MAG: glycosyltransferase family 39 protein, partial [Planctomycetes bacterium]|nr:glycosyltransferase family 39 protein [Planctomycetota bacterium]